MYLAINHGIHYAAAYEDTEIVNTIWVVFYVIHMSRYMFKMTPLEMAEAGKHFDVTKGNDATSLDSRVQANFR